MPVYSHLFRVLPSLSDMFLLKTKLKPDHSPVLAWTNIYLCKLTFGTSCQAFLVAHEILSILRINDTTLASV